MNGVAPRIIRLDQGDKTIALHLKEKKREREREREEERKKEKESRSIKRMEWSNLYWDKTEERDREKGGGKQPPQQTLS